MRQENEIEFKCFVKTDAYGKFMAHISVVDDGKSKYVKYVAQSLASCICNWDATKFKSFEELALNLELKFPGCRLKHESKMHEIVGISQEVLRELVDRREPLL